MMGNQQHSLLESPLETRTVLGLPLHLTQDYVQWVMQQMGDRHGMHIITLNAEMAIQAERNAALAETIRSAELVIPDGAGVVLYLWMRGRRIRRCPGIELAEGILQACPSHHASAFFIGGKPGVPEAAAQAWHRQLPELAIAGTYHGYLSPDDDRQLCETLAATNPSVILVGLGVPRQEFWIADHRHLCPHSVWIGVGGSFDIWAGVKERAPEWFCKNHLEWMYRLYQEPWRWKRMLALPKFAWKALVYSDS